MNRILLAQDWDQEKACYEHSRKTSGPINGRKLLDQMSSIISLKITTFWYGASRCPADTCRRFGKTVTCMLKVKHFINSKLSDSRLLRNVFRSGITAQKTVFFRVLPVKNIRAVF